MNGKRTDRRKRNIANIVALVLFMGMLFGGGIWQLFSEKPTYSASEKRDLAKMPELSVKSLLSGEYFRGIDAFYSDTFPGRERLVTMAAGFNDMKGIAYEGVKIYDGPSYSQDDPKQDGEEGEIKPDTPVQPEQPGAEQGTETTDPPQPGSAIDPDKNNGPDTDLKPADKPEPEGEADNLGNIIIYGNVAYEVFGGTQSSAERYADVISSYQKLMPNSTIYCMLVPTHAQIDLLPTKYGYLTQDQQPLIETIYNRLDPQIKSVDILPMLMNHRDEYLYYNTDHHWTADGAFYAYEVFCQVAGQTAVTRDQCTKAEQEGYLGSLYTSTKDSRLKNNPDTVVTYKIPTTVSVTNYDKEGNPSPGYLVSQSTNQYTAFLGGDRPFMSIATLNRNGRKLLILKESYGNAFSTIVAGNYEHVYVADIRNCPFNIVDLVNDQQIDDVLFINNMFAACTKARINDIENLQNKTMRFGQ